MAENVTTRMSLTGFPCWKCGGRLWRLDPPVYGWSYHCETCQHLTAPRHELDAAMASKSDDAVGIVAAVPCRIDPLGPAGTGGNTQGA